MTFVGLVRDLNAELTTPPTFDLGTGGKAHCGEAGECSYTYCPDPGCDPGQSKSCRCTKNGECGFWEKHTTYDCECTCGTTPPPPTTCTETPVARICPPGSGPDPKSRSSSFDSFTNERISDKTS